AEPTQMSKPPVPERAGNYCFKRSGGSATLVIELDGFEVARRSLSSFGNAQQREDFELYPTGSKGNTATGAKTAKFSYPPNEKTIGLYKKAADAETVKNRGK